MSHALNDRDHAELFRAAEEDGWGDANEPMTPRRQDSAPDWLFGHDQDDPFKLRRELGDVEAVPPAPPELCHMPAATERSFDPRFIRSLLHPIAHNLCGLFGFQTAQPKEDAKGADGGWCAQISTTRSTT